MTCGRMPCHPSQLRSGWRCNDDQLRSMSTTWPKRESRTDINSASSREISSVRGHQAPSILSPSRDARVSRSGLAARPGRTDHACRWVHHRSGRPPGRLPHGVRGEVGYWILLSRNDPDRRSRALHKATLRSSNRSTRETGRRSNRIARDLDGNALRGTAATADNETARWRRYATICSRAVLRAATLGSVAHSR
jgi:hypothetical protein